MGESHTGGQGIRPAVDYREAAFVVGAPALVTAVLAFVEPRLWHWFVLPLVACGVLCLSEAVRWLRLGADPFEPRAIIGTIGLIAYFLGPLLFVYWDLQLLYAVNPVDWRPYIGATAIICAAGWTIYLLVVDRLAAAPARPSRIAWRISTSMLLPMVAVTTVIGTVAHGRFVASAGAGLTAGGGERAAAVQGLGVLLPFSETVPIILFLSALHLLRAHVREARRFPWAMAALGGFLVLQFLFAGLRGSRTAMIVPTFWALAALPFAGIRVRRGPLVVATVFIVLGGLAYGYYKDLGSAAQSVLDAGLTQEELRQLAPARTPEYVLTADIARVGAQSAIVWRAVDGDPDFELAFGRTYLGGLLIVLPQSIWPGRPESKIKEGTILIQGRDAYLAGHRASQVYGLAAEGVMNFGLVGAPLVFAVWGWMVALLGRLRTTLAADDARRLLLPYFTYLSVGVLTGDFDNLVVGLVIMGALPTLVFGLASVRAGSRFERLASRLGGALRRGMAT